MLDLDVGDLDAPGVGLRVEDLLDVEVEPLALGQHLVERRACRAPRAAWSARAGWWRRGSSRPGSPPARGSTTRKYSTALTFTDTLSRVITSWVGTSSTTMRRSTRTICWMPGMRITRPGPLTLPEAPELEHDAALVLAQDAQRAGHEQQRQDDEDDRSRESSCDTPCVAALRPTGLTSSVRPSTRVTRTRSPALQRRCAAHAPALAVDLRPSLRRRCTRRTSPDRADHALARR